MALGLAVFGISLGISCYSGVRAEAKSSFWLALYGFAIHMAAHGLWEVICLFTG
jgi:hypothetical protein